MPEQGHWKVSKQKASCMSYNYFISNIRNEVLYVPSETHLTPESSLMSPGRLNGADEKPGGALNSFICTKSD